MGGMYGRVPLVYLKPVSTMLTVLIPGMNGVSSVREVDLETGDVLRQKVLAHDDFAEGVTRLNGRSGLT